MQDGISSTITKADLRRAIVRTFRLMGVRFHWLHKPEPANSFPASTLIGAAPVAGVSPSCAPATFFQTFDDARGDGAERFCSHLPFHSADNSREFQQDHG